VSFLILFCLCVLFVLLKKLLIFHYNILHYLMGYIGCDLTWKEIKHVNMICNRYRHIFIVRWVMQHTVLCIGCVFLLCILTLVVVIKCDLLFSATLNIEFIHLMRTDLVEIVCFQNSRRPSRFWSRMMSCSSNFSNKRAHFQQVAYQ
jgi:hypothetical protein